MAEKNDLQYGRACSLVVFGLDGLGLDLSELRIKFSIKRSNMQTPNTADIRIYNVKLETAKTIKREFTRVILQAGYKDNMGVIFQGNMKQVIIGRESATDTFIDIIGADGDLAYNFAIVNATIASGSSQEQQLATVMEEMKKKGVTQGYVQLGATDRLTRGKVMYGSTINYLRNVAQNTGQDFSIQNEKVQFVGLKTYLPGEAVVLTCKSGLVGTPQQTTQGVNMKCLLNPLLQPGGRVKIDNESVEDLKIDLNAQNAKQIRNNLTLPLNDDGVYFIFVAEHFGDTRGQEWYTQLTTLYVDETTDVQFSVSAGGGA